MTFTESVKTCLTEKFITFSGRAPRSEYWWFLLFSSLASYVMVFVDFALGLPRLGGYGPLSALWTLVMLVPGISVMVRRLHDVDRSGWWALILFVPLIGALLFIVFLAEKGTQGQNRFGPDPIPHDATTPPNFMEAVRICWREKFANFNDRASRSEYWWFILSTYFAMMLLVIPIALLGAIGGQMIAGIGGVFVILGLLAMIIPGLAVSVRRLHDIGRSGWWVLISLVPLIGGIVMLVFVLTRGTQGPNQFGPDPIATDQAEIFA